MRVGVLGVQGAVSEHVRTLIKTMSEMGLDGDVEVVRKGDQIKKIDALIIPGGESSTISRLLDTFELREKIISRVKNGMPIMGTCAGSVLLSSQGDEAVERSESKLLELMDTSVIRNAFGRQRESFECLLDIHGIADSFHAVFIRAPELALLPGSDAKVIAEFNDKIVGVEQGDILSFSFHPELTDDVRIHRYFLEKLI